MKEAGDEGMAICMLLDLVDEREEESERLSDDEDMFV